MSAADTTLLTRQREMLLQKLDEFERTNKALRRLLREQQATEVLQSNLILHLRLGLLWSPSLFSAFAFFCLLMLLFFSSSSCLWSHCRLLLWQLQSGVPSLFSLPFSPFFCPFLLCAVCSSSSLGTGQVKPGFSDWRINSGRKPSLQNTDRNPLVRERNFFAYHFLKPSSGWKFLCIRLQQ